MATNYAIQAVLDRYAARQARWATPVVLKETAPTPTAPAPKPALGSRVIHITDLGDYSRCPRGWNWSSMLRMGLQPAVSPVPLFFGSAVHYALDHGYRRCIGEEVAHFNLEDALKAFRGWMKQHIKRTIEYTGPLWEFEKESLREVRDLGILMLRHYDLWAAPLDAGFRVLGMEHKFRVPLPGCEEHGLEYAGRFDGLIQDIASGHRYILEFKTAKSIRSYTGGRSSNLAGVLRGMQPAAYTWASGQVYDEPARGILYRFLLKRAPDMPKPLATGGYSRAKSIKSSVAWFKDMLYRIAVEKHQGLPDQGEEQVPTAEDIYESEIVAAQGALSVLQQRQEISHGLVVGNAFFLQLPMTKKRAQTKGAVAALVGMGKRMVDPHQPIYPVSGFHCNWCSFKAPCDMIAYGHEDQVPAILDAAYGPRTYWEPEVQEEY